MQLSLHSDYALRVLLYLGARPGAIVTTRDVSAAYGISKHHLVRVAQTLRDHGYVELLAGRAGGMRLARDPGTIRLGEVVARTEPHLRLVECFDAATNTCPIDGQCQLKGHLHQAMQAFISALDQHTLGDLLAGRRGQRLTEAFVRLDVVKRRPPPPSSPPSPPSPRPGAGASRRRPRG